jgi:transposase
VENQLTFSLPQSEAGSKKAVFNSRHFLYREGEQWIIVAAGVPAYRYLDGDEIGEAYAMVFLVSSGYATQAEVARVYGCDVRTVRRHQRRYESGGMAALATRSGRRPGHKRLPVKRRIKIEKMHAEGLSNREIARRLLVSEKAIRKQVGPTKDNAAQLTLPMPLSREVTPGATTEKTSVEKCGVSEMPSEVSNSETTPEIEVRVPGSCDIDPRNRIVDRSLARFGLLSDAAPMFADAKGVKGAGVLFALPALI